MSTRNYINRHSKIIERPFQATHGISSPSRGPSPSRTRAAGRGRSRGPSRPTSRTMSTSGRATTSSTAWPRRRTGAGCCSPSPRRRCAATPSTGSSHQAILAIMWNRARAALDEARAMGVSTNYSAWFGGGTNASAAVLAPAASGGSAASGTAPPPANLVPGSETHSVSFSPWI